MSSTHVFSCGILTKSEMAMFTRMIYKHENSGSQHMYNTRMLVSYSYETASSDTLDNSCSYEHVHAD